MDGPRIRVVTLPSTGEWWVVTVPTRQSLSANLEIGSTPYESTMVSVFQVSVDVVEIEQTWVPMSLNSGRGRRVVLSSGSCRRGTYATVKIE